VDQEFSKKGGHEAAAALAEVVERCLSGGLSEKEKGPYSKDSSKLFDPAVVQGYKSGRDSTQGVAGGYAGDGGHLQTTRV